MRVLDVAVGGDQEAAGAGRRVLDDLAGLRLHQADHAVDQRARREVLAGAGLLLGGVLLQQALVEVAEPFLARGEPVELVDGGGQRLEVGRLAQLGLGVGEDGEDGLILGLRGVAEIEQQTAVVGRAGRGPRAWRVGSQR